MSIVFGKSNNGEYYANINAVIIKDMRKIFVSFHSFLIHRIFVVNCDYLFSGNCEIFSVKNQQF
jgi:hypothetical protein